MFRFFKTNIRRYAGQAADINNSDIYKQNNVILSTIYGVGIAIFSYNIYKFSKLESDINNIRNSITSIHNDINKINNKVDKINNNVDKINGDIYDIIKIIG